MKYIHTLLLLLFVSLTIQGQEIDDNILSNRHYKNRMELFRFSPTKKRQIVFFGNSITEIGKWSSYFPNHDVVNRGISGDNTDGMIARIHEVVKGKPSKIFLMAGINDISLQRSNEVILRQTKLLLRQIKAGSPDTEIFVQSILPINTQKLKYSRLKDKQQQIEDYNTMLKAMCNEMDITYIDVYSKLLDSPRNLNPQYTQDGLHINNEAYQEWVKILKPYLEEKNKFNINLRK